MSDRHSSSADFIEHASITQADYERLYQQSVSDPEQFWHTQAVTFLSWNKPWARVLTGDFHQHNVRWFEGGELNACYNCIDRHLPKRATQTALIWEGDEPTQQKSYTYQQLFHEVCRTANILKKLGISKGERVCIYLPMIPEAIICMLAAARIGAIHSVVFGGFSPQSLASRIQDARCKLVITTTHHYRGGKLVPYKQNVDEALKNCPFVTHTLVISEPNEKWHSTSTRDVAYHTLYHEVSDVCSAVAMQAEDPLFILYTSGSTGTPKGILHTTAGYLLYAAITHKYIFDYHENEVYWCTADIGWITGHSYIVYGPLCNGATTLIFSGVPHYPNYSRFWQIIDRHRVNIFYTAPTALRALRKEGDAFINAAKLDSLRLLGSVGEPINPEVWEWYHRIVGKQLCPIVDTWWQTETGGILISPFPGATAQKPGAACKPFFGIVPALLDETGTVHADTPARAGALLISQPWPGIARSIYGDHQRYIDTYFGAVPGFYFSGDGAFCDEDSDWWISGRIDDVINVSGHRLGTAEIESALLQHPAVAEAAVVGTPHEIKGQGICAFVVLINHVDATPPAITELIDQIVQSIGAIAKPEKIHYIPALPKTRSGKIMRRILRKMACGETEDLGDTSTLAEPHVVEQILAVLSKR